MAHFFFDLDEGLQIQNAQLQATYRQFGRMLNEILVAAVCTDCSEQVERPKTRHQKLMTRRSHMGCTGCESPLSLPSVEGVKIMKSRKEMVDIV